MPTVLELKKAVLERARERLGPDSPAVKRLEESIRLAESGLPQSAYGMFMMLDDREPSKKSKE